MKAFMEKVGEWVRHNLGLFVAICLSIPLLVWGFGCESKVKSIEDPAQWVTREELAVEVQAVQQANEAKFEDLISDAELAIKRAQEDAVIEAEQLKVLVAKKERLLQQQDDVKAAILEMGLVLAEGGTVNPLGAGLTILGILGIGAVRDNAKKDGLLTDMVRAPSTTT